MICPFYFPWTTTSKGEINRACVCPELLRIKDCDNCINKDEAYTGDDAKIKELALKKLKL